MSLTNQTGAELRHADRFFIGGEWVTPSSDARIDVIDSATEELFFSVAEAQADDISRAVAEAGRLRPRAVVAPDPRGTGRVPARDRRHPAGTYSRFRADLAARVRRATPDRTGGRTRRRGNV